MMKKGGYYDGVDCGIFSLFTLFFMLVYLGINITIKILEVVFCLLDNQKEDSKKEVNDEG